MSKPVAAFFIAALTLTAVGCSSGSSPASASSPAALAGSSGNNPATVGRASTTGGVAAPAGGGSGATLPAASGSAGTRAAAPPAVGTIGTAGSGAMSMTPPADQPNLTADSICSLPKQNPQVGNPCPGTPPPGLKLTEIASGFLSPTYVLQAPNDASRLYVLEQQGTVRVVKDGALSADAFVDLRDLSGAPVNNSTILATYGEGGLLGAVFDPRFEQTKRLWLSYTKPGPAFSIAQFTVDNPDKLDVTQYKEFLSFPQYGFFQGSDATNHVGSMLAFGADGCMYVSRGDGGGEMDRQMSGQKTTDDLCSILRIDVDKYPTPAPGNLDAHVWSFGFRNPWRFSFDRATGDMYVGDVGQDVDTGYEEINIEPRGVMGRNYGWSIAQGSKICDGDCSKMTKPAHEYGITDTQNSVIGGYVYRGKKIPGLLGRYVWADWTERIVKTLVYKGDHDGQPEVCDEYDTAISVPTKVRSFGEGVDGELYLVAGGAPSTGLSSAGLMEAGTLYRIDGDGSAAPPASGGAAGSAATGGGGNGGVGNQDGMSAATGAPTFSAIYSEILTRGATGNCMFGACHGGEPDPATNGGLQIKAGDRAGTYMHLVRAMSTSMTCMGTTYVIPGDSANSLIVQKISDTPPCGARMPIGNPLSAAQIAQIAMWIERGAQDD